MRNAADPHHACEPSSILHRLPCHCPPPSPSTRLPQARLTHPFFPRAQNKNVVSVKGGCLNGLDWSRAIHIWTKSAMIPIPEGSEFYSEESTRTSGYGDSQECLDQPGMLAGSGGCMNQSPSEDGGAGDRPRGPEGLCDLAGPDMKAVLHGM